MKLASLRDGSPDGTLVVVDRNLRTCIAVPEIARTMRDALDRWESVEGDLAERSNALNAGHVAQADAFVAANVLAPLPRAYGWIDGTSYLWHMKRARALRGAELPDDFATEPLMTERISTFLAATDDLPLSDDNVDMDFEGEVAVILGNVPMRSPVAAASAPIRLITLVNDVSLRAVLAQTALRGRSVTLLAKPFPTMAPVAVTPNELGAAWDGQLLRLPLLCHVNDRLIACPDGGLDATFTFPELIAYCASHRPLPGGTVIAAGTLSNEDEVRGGACIAERRLIETKQSGKPATDYLRVGDRLRLEMFDARGQSVFGAIDQRIVRAQSPTMCATPLG